MFKIKIFFIYTPMFQLKDPPKDHSTTLEYKNDAKVSEIDDYREKLL